MAVADEVELKNLKDTLVKLNERDVERQKVVEAAWERARPQEEYYRSMEEAEQQRNVWSQLLIEETQKRSHLLLLGSEKHEDLESQQKDQKAIEMEQRRRASKQALMREIAERKHYVLVED